MAYGTLAVDTLNSSTGVLATQNGMTGIAKAWCNYDGTTQTIIGSFNISSVTYTSTGTYTFNLANAVANTNGALLASKSNQTTNAANAQGINWTSTSGFQLVNYEAGSKVNSPVFVAAFSS